MGNQGCWVEAGMLVLPRGTHLVTRTMVVLRTKVVLRTTIVLSAQDAPVVQGSRSSQGRS